MLEKVRRLLGEQQDSDGSYPQTVWTDQFLLDGVNQAGDRLERDGFWWLVKKDTSISTVSGTNKYAVPTGLQEVESIFIGTVGAGLELTPVSPFDFDNLVAGSAYMLESDGTTPGTAYIYVYPTPTLVQTMTIKGIFRQAQLEARAQGTITMSGVATANETFVIDTQTFTWKASRSTTGEVTIGASAAAAADNIITAVNLDLADFTATKSGSATVLISADSSASSEYSTIFTESSTNMAVDGSGTLGGTPGTSTTTSLPDRYHMFFVWSAVAYAHERQEEPGLADRARAFADEIYGDIWRNEIAPGGQEIVRFKHPGEYLR